MSTPLPPAMRILITGASRGIGRYIAESLAQPGRMLILVARKASHLESIADLCEERGADVCTFGVNLAKRDCVNQLIKVVRSDGAPDMIINCAGIMGSEVAPWESDPDSWWLTQLVNVRAPYLLQRGFVPDMLARGGGRILDLSSGAAVTDSSVASDYWVSKTALMRLGGSLHEAGYSSGLRVLEMSPGVINSDMTRDMAMHEGRTDWTDPGAVVEIVKAFADGELDGISGTYVRAGTDSIDELKARSQRGIGESARRLRITPWE